MSANIYVNENTGQASFFTANGKPAWHGMGKVLDNPLTAKEAIIEAGLDFEVVKEPMFLEDGKRVKKYFATVRQDNYNVLGVVGSRYTVVQNSEAFGFFDAIVEDDEAIYETGGVLGQGEKIWIMAKLPGYIHVPGTALDDDIETFVVLMNTHDGSSPVIAFTTHVRVVCANTLSFAMRGSKNKVRIRHTASVNDQLAAAHHALGISNKFTEEMEQIWGDMARKEISDKFINNLMDEILPLPEPNENGEIKAPKIKKARLAFQESVFAGAGQDMPGMNGTVWGLYNGATYWIDHVKNYRNDNAGRLKGIWMGSGAQMRDKTFKFLKEYTYA